MSVIMRDFVLLGFPSTQVWRTENAKEKEILTDIHRQQVQGRLQK